MANSAPPQAIRNNCREPPAQDIAARGRGSRPIARPSRPLFGNPTHPCDRAERWRRARTLGRGEYPALISYSSAPMGGFLNALTEYGRLRHRCSCLFWMDVFPAMFRDIARSVDPDDTRRRPVPRIFTYFASIWNWRRRRTLCGFIRETRISFRHIPIPPRYLPGAIIAKSRRRQSALRVAEGDGVAPADADCYSEILPAHPVGPNVIAPRANLSPRRTRRLMCVFARPGE